MGATHVEESSPQTGKLYTCEHCQMTFSRPVHLERHMRNVHSQERESVCNICQKLFQNKHYLSVHMLTHNVNKELQCPLCKMAFNNLASLNKHKDAHLGIGLAPVQKDNPNNFRHPRTVANLLAAAAATNQQPNRANPSNVPLISVAPGLNNATTLNCDLRSTDLRSMNKNKRNLLSNPVSLQNAMRVSSNDTTVNCDLTSRDINSLNTNQDRAVRMAQKRPSNSDNDVIVTGVSSLKRPFRFQNLSNSTAAQNRQPQLSKAAAISLLSQQLASSQNNSQNSLLQNQIQVQSSNSRQNSAHNSSGRNVTDRIYLLPENSNNRNVARMQPPSNFRYSQRKQLAAQQPIPNQRYSTNNLYSTPLSQHQQSQRNVVNCDLTRSDLATISQRSGAAASNMGSQFSNGNKLSNNSTVNCDLTISNISSLNRNYRSNNNNNLIASRSRNAVSQNNLPSNRVRSAVNFDLTTDDINFLRRNRRIRQVGRLTDVGAATSGGQTSNTLNCDLSVVNLGAMERNKMLPSNNSRIGRINLNQIPKQVQNTLNSSLRANNINDWNKRNTIMYQQKANQILQNPASRSVNTLNCDLTNVNLGTLNQQQAANNNIINQQVRPVQIYANSNLPLNSLVRKEMNARENNMTSSSNNSFPVQIVRNRNQQKRPVNNNQLASALNIPNAMLISRLNRQRKMLATNTNTNNNNNIIPVIDLVAEEEKASKVTSGSTEVVQFDLTNPDINIISYENGTSLSSSKSTSKNVVDIVDLESHDSSGRPSATNNRASVVEFDLSNNNIRAFNTNQNRISNTSTINLNSNLWTSSNSARNNSLNVQSATIDNNASSSSLSDITLVDIRSLRPSGEISETVGRHVDEVGEKSSVSGITLVDIRSLSSAEIEANFQTANKEPLTIPNLETSELMHSGKDSESYQVGNSSLTASKVSTLNSLNQASPSKEIITVDLSSIDFEDLDEAKSMATQPSKPTSDILEDDSFTCKYCSVKTRFLYNYIFHLKSHLETGFCICYYCDSVFEDFRKLVVHLVSHVSNLKNQCVFCRNVLISSTNPIQHMTECGELQCVMFEAGSCVKTEQSEVKNESKVSTETKSGIAEKTEKEVGNLEERLLEEVEKQALVILANQDKEMSGVADEDVSGVEGEEKKTEEGGETEKREEEGLGINTDIKESDMLQEGEENERGKSKEVMEGEGSDCLEEDSKNKGTNNELIEGGKEETTVEVGEREQKETEGVGGEVEEEEGSKESGNEEKLDEDSIEWKVKQEIDRTDQLISELNQDSL